MFIEKELGYKRHWINIDSDIISEQSYLYTKYDIDQETIEYALDKNERAHMDYNRETGTITFIYNVLALEKDKEHYETIPLTFIVQARGCCTDTSRGSRGWSWCRGRKPRSPDSAPWCGPRWGRSDPAHS